MKQMNKQAGFTLIELIIVIVILGILSAFALPRFADMASEARTASLQGLAGSLKAASAIAHSQWIVDDTGTLTATTVSLEGADIDMIFGYPTATATGITAAAQINETDPANPDYTAVAMAGSPAGIQYQLQSSATCSVTYTVATATTSPTVVVDSTDC